MSESESEEETLLMAKFGISAEAKTVYHYQGQKYDRLKDAVNYAEKVASELSTDTR